jgi:hypothetical protein
MRTRPGAVALGVAGVLFLLYPAVRPWTNESTVDGARAAMSSGAWVASHLFAMLGFILVPAGLQALCRTVSGTGGGSLARIALVTGWIGVGLTLPYYGAEDFGLNAIARKSAEGQQLDLLSLVDAVRFGPVQATMFAVGLLSLGAGAVLAAAAVWRSTHGGTAVLPRYSAVPFAVGFASFIPQFYAPPAVRIAHGVLVAVGSVWLAVALWRAAAERSHLS